MTEPCPIRRREILFCPEFKFHFAHIEHDDPRGRRIHEYSNGIMNWKRGKYWIFQVDECENINQAEDIFLEWLKTSQ